MSVLPGRGSLARITAGAQNPLRGIGDGLKTEAAIKQEIALAVTDLSNQLGRL